MFKVYVCCPCVSITRAEQMWCPAILSEVMNVSRLHHRNHAAFKSWRTRYPTPSLPPPIMFRTSFTRSMHTSRALRGTAMNAPKSTPEWRTRNDPQTGEPIATNEGAPEYVQAQGDPATAYPTSAPYINYPAADAPPSAPQSSTSSSPAHPVNTAKVPHDESGVGQSSAQAPGDMEVGSYGGLGLMDKQKK